MTFQTDPEYRHTLTSAPRRSMVALQVALLTIALPAISIAQPETPAESTAAPTDNGDDQQPSTPTTVNVDPLADDNEIGNRLTRILEATDRFQNAQVRVNEGVVFLNGSTRKDEFRTWAGDLASKTQDVVAVVNQIEVVPGPIWDLSPAWTEMRNLLREVVQTAPLIGLALLLLLATWFAARLAIRLADWLLSRQIGNRLLRDVATRAVAIPVFLMGLYLILRISGLTQMAATVLGGTGLIGLIVGIAFRDIAENFLASILISIQRPFVLGDLIELGGHRGYVQSVTTRGTLLMTLDGNHVQIPNSTVYKEVIQNFTANPTMRLHFTIGIGYDDSVTNAQQVALEVIRNHPVVLADPEPLVLVDQLGSATVNLHVYFWINIQEYSEIKARSSVLRLVKRAFDKAGISMPDEAREVVFPEGVPISTPGEQSLPRPSSPQTPAPQRVPDNDHEEDVSSAAEGDLTSEAGEIEQQARQSRSPDSGTNLLEEDQLPESTPAR